MRVILDTNVLLSGLIRADGIPGRILEAWFDDRFVLLQHEFLLEELRLVTRRPHIRNLIRRAEAGRLVNQIRTNAMLLTDLPPIHRSDDPADDFLLAMSEAGDADYLVTGDKAGLLRLGSHGRTRILTARDFVQQLSGK